MYILSLIATIALIIFDQLTKYLAFVYLKPAAQLRLIPEIFHFSYVENEGAAFGMMQGGRWIFIVLTSIVIGIIIFYYTRLPKGKIYSWIRFSLILIVAGALGNFIDRLLNGYVIDFFYFVPINFPVFNMADVYVVCGSILLGVLIIFFLKDNKGAETSKN